MKRPKILDCTLRDGSYVLDFQIDAKLTSQIVAELDKLKFPYIEIGHGMGLGASRLAKMKAAETDETYLESAAKSARNSCWGMFCIPEIATLDDLRMAADYGMGFVRVGSNFDQIEKMFPYLELARKLKMEVCANVMKTYACDPQKYGQLAHTVYEHGAEVIYVVDSAGGMLPNEIQEYVDSVKMHNPKIKIGFHGHDNLGLGVSNAVKAFECGVDIIDSSMQRLGRSAGNTCTEQLISVLLRMGVDVGIDPIEVMNISENLIRPLVQMRGVDSVDVVSGLSLFHSSFLEKLEAASEKFEIDVRDLIVSVCTKNKVSAPDDLVAEEAEKLANIDFSRRQRRRLPRSA